MIINDNAKVKKYVESIAKKLDDPKTTRYLQFGTKAEIAGQPMLRDAVGLGIAKAAMLQTAENLYTVTGGRDEIARAYKNFAEAGNKPSTGIEQVSGVKTVGAMDVTILAMSQSIIPFVALDRSMATPDVTIYYNDLVSTSEDGVGGVENGEVVNGNFSPPNAKVDLGPDFTATGTAADGAVTVTANTNVIPGSAEVTITVGADEFTGRDYASDGVLYFPAGSGVTEATVDYDTGAVVVKATGLTKAEVYLKKDQSADKNGSSTLKVTNKWTPITLHADPQNIILEDNLMNRMYMANTQAIATAGAGGTSAADVLFARTKNTYVEYLNAKVIRETLKGFTFTTGTAKDPTSDIFLDLSDYSVNNWAVTKNDLVSQVINNLRAKFLGRNNLGGTSILTGSYGVSLLSNIPNMWVANPDQFSGLNGLAGYFQGVPVYRHSYIDQTASNGRAHFYMVAKTPDNNSGSSVFGEYIPLTSTGVVSNYAMPSNISNGFFSMVGSKKVTASLVMRAEIILPSAGLFADIH